MKLAYAVWAKFPDWGEPVELTLETLLRQIAKIGYEAVEIGAFRGMEAFYLYMSDEKIRQVNQLIDSLGLTLTCIDAGGGSPLYSSEYGYLVRDTMDRAATINFMKKTIDLASQMKTGNVVDLSGRKPPNMKDPQAWELLVSCVGEICDYAASRKINYLIETENGFLVHNAETILKLIQAVDSSAMKVNFDYSNFLLDGSSEEQIKEAIRKLSKYIVNAHIKGVGKDPKTSNHIFVIPGGSEEVQDIHGYLNALKEIGYQGALMIEDLPYAQTPPKSTIESAMLSYATMSKILKDREKGA